MKQETLGKFILSFFILHILLFGQGFKIKGNPSLFSKEDPQPIHFVFEDLNLAEANVHIHLFDGHFKEMYHCTPCKSKSRTESLLQNLDIGFYHLYMKSEELNGALKSNTYYLLNKEEEQINILYSKENWIADSPILPQLLSETNEPIGIQN